MEEPTTNTEDEQDLVQKNLDRQDALEQSALPTQIGLQWGVIAGVVLIVFSIIRYIVSIDLYLNTWMVLLTYPIIVGFMIAAVLLLVKKQNKFALFKQALKAAFITSTISVLLAGGFGMFMIKVVDPNLPKYQKAQTIDITVSWMEWAGASEEDIDIALERLEEETYDPTFSQMAMGFGMQIIIGFIFALMIALVCYLVYKDQVPVNLTA